MNTDITYVIGHKNPDSDSICSAIALTELKKALGEKNIFAARAGDINPQTAFILDYFNIKAPLFLPNVYPTARDIMTCNPLSVSSRTPLFEAMRIMKEQNIRFIPIIDNLGKPTGILTLMDLAKRHISQIAAPDTRSVFTSLSNICKTLNATILTDYLGIASATFQLYVGAMAENTFIRVLDGKDEKKRAVIVGDRQEIQAASVEMGIDLIIITGGLKVAPEIIAAAKQKSVTIVVSPRDTATTALLVGLSTPVHSVGGEEVETAGPDDLVEDLQIRMAKNQERGVVVLDDQGRLEGVVTRSNLLKKPDKKLILVDHNELSQAVEGADQVTISKVVDHHRLGNFHTAKPITFLCEPVGSTSTLVAEMYRDKQVDINKEIAGLLLAGVLSDTIVMKSPTTTDRDKKIIAWLEKMSGLDHQTFGREIFTASSSLKKRGAKNSVQADYKTFEAKGEKFGIGQVETIGFDEFYDVKQALMKELSDIKKVKNLKLSALLITDIVIGASLLLAVGEKEAMMNLNYPKIEDNVYELKNVLSRKKQVAPSLLSLFNEIY